MIDIDSNHFQGRGRRLREENLELIEQAQSGDLDAFREIVDSYSSFVHSVAYQMVGNSEDAKDITQEVFLRLYKSLKKYNSGFKFTTWLYRLTVNISIDYHRKNLRHRYVSIDEVKDETILKDSNSLPDINAECNEMRGTINLLLGNLSPKQRTVFVLRDFQNFSTEEVAKILRCSQITVRVHLTNARKHIKKMLRKIFPDHYSNNPSREVKSDEVPKG